MVSTTFGAVAGPNLVNVMGDFALSIGVPALAGPFILSGAAFISAGLFLFIFLRPDPFIVALKISVNKKAAGFSDVPGNLKTNENGITVGAIIMVVTQIVMLAIMTMTPVHMGNHGHSLRAIGLVIGFHIGAMYLPDPFIVALKISVNKKAAGFSDVPGNLKTNENGITVGAIIMVVTQIVMLAIMTMTPVHMGNHGHSLRAIGLVIGFHIGAMYL